MTYGLSGLLVLILDIYAIYLVINSSADSSKKLLWVILILLVPVIGPILYLLLGR